MSEEDRISEAVEDIEGLARILDRAAEQEFYYFAGLGAGPVYRAASKKLKEVAREFDKGTAPEYQKDW